MSRRGEVARAMLQAAWPPARVTQVCERAQVGYGVGRYTATRLVQAGELVVVSVPPPAQGTLGRPAAVVASREALMQHRRERHGAPAALPPLSDRSFWDTALAST